MDKLAKSLSDFLNQEDAEKLKRERNFTHLSHELTLWANYKCSGWAPEWLPRSKENDLLAFMSAHYPQRSQELREVFRLWNCSYRKYDNIQELLSKIGSEESCTFL